MVGSVALVGCDDARPSASPSASVVATGSFDSIQAADGFRVTVSPGTSSTVQVRSSGIPANQVQVTIADGVLTLRTASGPVPAGATLSADVTAESLVSVTGTSGALIRLSRGVALSGKTVRLKLSAGAEFSGAVRAKDFTADLKAGSSATLTGSVARAKVAVTEASTVRAGDLELTEASVDMSAGATALMNVKRAMAVSLSTGASLSYLGEPKITKQRVTTGATLRRVEP
ncbi:MAG: DUF2807 domain-containing protein [Candidatus Nanopelagicales bacterium]|nr:DUF2807 domain-containing protein [Candidatus Nanopelagicales bacterium]